MAGNTIIDKIAHKQAMRRWARAARNATDTELGDLRGQRGAARMLRTHLDRLIHAADERLALPAIGSHSFPRHSSGRHDQSALNGLGKECDPIDRKSVV